MSSTPVTPPTTSAMPTAHIFSGTSLDGFIARPDGSLDWLLPFSSLGEDHGFDAHMESMDCVIMGRKTFHRTVGYKPVLVMSCTLMPNKIPGSLRQKTEKGWPKVKVISGEPKETMEMAKQRGRERVCVDGGEVIRKFLREGSMVIIRVPVLIGKGVPLFGDLDGDVKLVHKGTRSWESGVVQSRYRVVRMERKEMLFLVNLEPMKLRRAWIEWKSRRAS